MMPLQRSRLLPVSPSCLFFNGVNQYAVVGLRPDGSGAPFTVYGWSEITVEHKLYLVWPKPSTTYAVTGMIGSPWENYPSMSLYTSSPQNYSEWYIDFVARTSGGTRADYVYRVVGNWNTWLHVVQRFTSSREVSFFINATRVYGATVPSDYTTILEQNPDATPYPERYKRFVLGVDSKLAWFLSVRHSYLRIYRRALTDEEILWNFYYPDNPVRNGLVLWLHWDSIDTATGVWYDKSGFGNHATLYNNPVKEDVLLPPKRVLSPTRTLSPTR